MIGERIAKLRYQQGWSQSMLGRMLHLSTKTIKNWEAGISDPSAENIILLSNIFSISSDYILEIDDDQSISLKGLSIQDQQIVKAMIQAYIQVAVRQERQKI